MESKELPILIVDDSPEDFETTCRAFKKVNFRNEIRRCEDGDEALAYLFNRGKYHDVKTAPKPSIILLDLNMPGTDGRAVLKQIKEDHTLSKIPVIILTTSKDHRDIDDSYLKGASGFIQKPVSFDGFVNAIRNVKEYWLDTVLLPNRTL